jgi:hypothetical protein
MDTNRRAKVVAADINSVETDVANSQVIRVALGESHNGSAVTDDTHNHRMLEIAEHRAASCGGRQV